MGVEMEMTMPICHSGVSSNGTITFEMYGIERHVVAPTNVQIELIRSPNCG